MSRFNGLSDDALKTIVVCAILVVWVLAVLHGVFISGNPVDASITTMMGSVVGYFLVEKVVNKIKKDKE